LKSSTESQLTARPARRAYIDWARGIAVLIMIHAHVLDAWTLPAERSRVAFGYLNLIGGFAAPLFLWLAGVSVAIAAERRLQGGQPRASAALALTRRGTEIFLLAFIFRAQAFVVSPGNPLTSLLRVDILNIMGPAMMLSAVLWGIAGGPRRATFACGLVATLIAVVTPPIRTATWLTVLPDPVQWYISPSGNHSTFTLFPWSGFVLAGAAYGSLFAKGMRTDERRTLMRLALVGLGIAVASYVLSYRPSIYVVSSFWTTSPTYFALRTGAMMALLAGLFSLEASVPGARGSLASLARLGRSSLFVYWIHVELVYGYATLWIHHKLPIWGTALAYAGFVVLMYWAIALRDHVVQRWRGRTSRSSSPALEVGRAQ
jgi:uncharacterized membrane protein